MKNILVLYHKDCYDGFGAAWAAWKKFGKKADYLAIKHSDTPLKTINKIIFLLDISYGHSQMKALLEKNEVILIDHHLTNKDIPKIIPNSVFSLKNSAAYLAWRYFHKRAPPKLVFYLEDYDLWRSKLPNTGELSAYIHTKKFDFELWDELSKDFENKNNRNEFAKYGKNILEFEKRAIEFLISNAEVVSFAGHRIFAVNSPLFVDRLCHALAVKKPPFAFAWSKRGDMIKVDLRSTSSFDVSKIARRFGGGGHKESAGFSFQASKKFPWKKIN
ncbi:hypothetical protein HYW53_00750 [Candidatus Giovannonibacteria bacterium]|nr:hypothetical protein [Candidatus Giovannonibacteria bacterium]